MARCQVLVIAAIMHLGSSSDSIPHLGKNGMFSLTLGLLQQREEASLPSRVVVKMGDSVSQTDGICYYLIGGIVAAFHWEVNK